MPDEDAQWPPCGSSGCPVPNPASSDLSRFQTATIDKGIKLFRGARIGYPIDEFVPSLGNSRFAPIAGRQHLYLARTRSAAILESALQEASGPQPTIYRSQLARWELAQVSLSSPLQLIDLRDPALSQLGLEPAQLTTTTPRHYPCTRAWAATLADHNTPAGETDGLLWTSRQAHAHAQTHSGGLAGDLLVHQPIEVAVLWKPPYSGQISCESPPEPLLSGDGHPARIVVELANIIGTPIF